MNSHSIRIVTLLGCLVTLYAADYGVVSGQEFRIRASAQQLRVQQTDQKSVTQTQLASQAAVVKRLEGELNKRGIPPTQEGIRKYLQEIHPNEEQNRQAYALISQLGNENFAIREKATQSLFRMPALPAELLKEASKSADPEIAWRAMGLLDMGKIEFGNTLRYVLQYVEKKPVQGLTPELLKAIPLCISNSDYRTARAALLSSFTPEDVDLLVQGLKSDNLQVRKSVAFVLAQAAADSRQDVLESIAGSASEDPIVRIEAVEALANLGQRDSLPILVDLLEAEDVSVRVRASVILRQFTGNTFQFAAYDKDERRAEALGKWKEWLANESETAELTFPLSLARHAGSYLNGNTLLALGYSNRVIELDPEGNEVYSVEAQGAWMAERLESGNTLVAAYSSNKLVEFNPEGESVWEMDAPSVLSARPLENGNFLIAQHSPGIIKEVNHGKETVWEYTTGGSACDAIRLPNGNTLIAYANNVDEVTPDKEVVWSYTGNQIYGMSVVENGNILVAQLNGNVQEINRDTKDVVWEYATSNPVDAIRLPNGNTLVTSNNKFLEVTPEKEIVWERGGCSYGTARR